MEIFGKCIKKVEPLFIEYQELKPKSAMGYNRAEKKMKKLFLTCLTVIGFVFVANDQVCETEGKKCVTSNGDRGVCRNVTVTESTTSSNGYSSSGTSGYNVNASASAQVGSKYNNVSATVGGGYNSSNTQSNSNQRSTTTTESWNELKCKKQNDGAAQATPTW